MQVNEVKSEGLSREYKIALPANEIEEKLSTRLEEIAKTATMPGFRPGKVPVKVLKKRYGQSLMGEVLEAAVSSSAQQAIAEKGVRPAGQPEFELDQYEDGKDLEYTMTFDILPEITVPDFGKIELERMTPKVDDKEVEEALQRIADANKTSEPIKKKRKSKAGDIVVIDFVGKIDGEPFAGGSAEGYELELGSNSFIPGFEDQLTGVDADTDNEVKVSFPEEYGAEELAGKEAVFDVKVQEIRETTPSPIDDELAKKAGAEDLDKLREMIKEEQSREFKEYARMQVKKQLLDTLADRVSFELPPKLAEGEYQSILHQWQHEQHGSAADHSQGENPEEAHAIEPSDEEVKDFREMADRRVRLGLLLSEIGQQNNIQVGQEDMNRAMMQEARKYPGQEQQVLEYFKSNPEALQQAAAPMFEDKIVDFVLEMAKISEKPTTMEELVKVLQAEAEADEKPAEKKKAAPKKKTAAKKKAPAKKAAAKKDADADKGDD